MIAVDDDAGHLDRRQSTVWRDRDRRAAGEVRVAAVDGATRCGPTGSAAIDRLAWPVASSGAGEPRLAPSTVNCTVPVGMPLPGEVAVTWAVSVTLSPTVAIGSDDWALVDVLAMPTVSVCDGRRAAGEVRIAAVDGRDRVRADGEVGDVERRDAAGADGDDAEDASCRRGTGRCRFAGAAGSGDRGGQASPIGRRRGGGARGQRRGGAEEDRVRERGRLAAGVVGVAGVDGDQVMRAGREARDRDGRRAAGERRGAEDGVAVVGIFEGDGAGRAGAGDLDC